MRWKGLVTPETSLMREERVREARHVRRGGKSSSGVATCMDAAARLRGDAGAARLVVGDEGHAGKQTPAARHVHGGPVGVSLTLPTSSRSSDSPLPAPGGPSRPADSGTRAELRLEAVCQDDDARSTPERRAMGHHAPHPSPVLKGTSRLGWLVS